MGIRETLNKNQTLTTGATIFIILVAIGVIVWQMMPEKPPRLMSKAYYTNDDGKSWFEDSADKIVPYDKDGKETVRAHLFQCSGGAPFVGYLEKLDPKVKQKLDEFYANPSNKGRIMPGQIEQEENGRLVKRPLDKNWLPDSNPAAARITTIKCKDGSYATRVTPDMPQ
ncbi:MAG TPA: hypothetical protein VGQ99_02325 [Tepidisphaeraceae bacterium]|nr:hypothetical protein [Tepidisphaeraceae bacterium]